MRESLYAAPRIVDSSTRHVLVWHQLRSYLQSYLCYHARSLEAMGFWPGALRVHVTVNPERPAGDSSITSSRSTSASGGPTCGERHHLAHRASGPSKAASRVPSGRLRAYPARPSSVGEPPQALAEEDALHAPVGHDPPPHGVTVRRPRRRRPRARSISLVGAPQLAQHRPRVLRPGGGREADRARASRRAGRTGAVMVRAPSLGSSASREQPGGARAWSSSKRSSRSRTGRRARRRRRAARPTRPSVRSRIRGANRATSSGSRSRAPARSSHGGWSSRPGSPIASQKRPASRSA